MSRPPHPQSSIHCELRMRACTALHLLLTPQDPWVAAQAVVSQANRGESQVALRAASRAVMGKEVAAMAHCCRRRQSGTWCPYSALGRRTSTLQGSSSHSERRSARRSRPSPRRPPCIFPASDRRSASHASSPAPNRRCDLSRRQPRCLPCSLLGQDGWPCTYAHTQPWCEE